LLAISTVDIISYNENWVSVMMLNRNQSVSLYEQLKRIIQDKIKSGEWKPGDQLPSERELVEEYQISRITVRQAIDLAEREGLVNRVHGVGTFVAHPKIKQELSKVNTFQSTLEEQGLVASTKVLQLNVITSDMQLAKMLDIEVMDKALTLELLGYGDSRPIVYYHSYFSFSVGKKIESAVELALKEGRPFSTRDFYTTYDVFDSPPTHVDQTFEAVGANEYLSKVLDVELHYPLFRVTSIVYRDKTPLEFKETYYRGDKYKFFITRQM
jgi:GntR family transcriptional regulator